MKRFILITFLAIGSLTMFNSCSSEQTTSTSQVEDTTPAKKGKDLLLVKYHADWCGSCKALTPILSELNNQLEGKTTRFVELDFTDETTALAAKSMSEELGISEYLTEKQKTGYVAIIDANSKEVLGKLTKKQSVNDMYDQVVSHL